MGGGSSISSFDLKPIPTISYCNLGLKRANKKYMMSMISIVTSLIACLSQHFNVVILYHIGDVCKQYNHPILLTTGDMGGQMSLCTHSGEHTFKESVLCVINKSHVRFQ